MRVAGRRWARVCQINEIFARIDAGQPLPGHEGLLKGMLKASLERGLEAELSDHLGYDCGNPDAAPFANSRNGCVPIDDEFDQARLGWRPADRPARLRLVADAYGLDGVGRAELRTAMGDVFDRIEAAVRRSVDAGHPNTVEMWNRAGGSERYDRRRRWWIAHSDQFATALR